MRTTDLIGKTFNNLTVTEFAYSKDGRGYWKCKCTCGNETVVLRSNLPKIKSCGCLLTTNKYVGKFPEQVRQAYYNMRKRCYSKSNKSYKDYGGRGITICEEWSTLEGFLNDMLESYQEGLTLDRIDVDKNYCKENCRWVSLKKQANNKRTNFMVEYKGEKMSLTEICERYSLNYSFIRKRILEGNSIEEAMNIPVPKKEEITFNGITKTVSEFAEEYGMTYYQLKKRLMRGWSVEKALTQPLRTRRG